MGAPELKPCPFCGGEAGKINDATRILGTWNVIHRCPVIGPIKIEASLRENVVAAWNRRADLPPTLSDALALPEIAALVDAAIVYKDERMKLDDTPAFCDLTAALSAITKEPR